MNRIIKIFSASLLCLLAAACSDEDFKNDGIPSDGSLHVDYLVDGEVMETRSVQAVDDEIKLESALIFFYDLASNRPLCYKYVKPSAGKRTLSFDPPAELRANVEYATLVVGNPDYYTGATTVEAFANSVMDMNYAEARLNISYVRRDPIVRDKPGVLPMYGQFVDPATKMPKTFRFRESDAIVSAEGMFYFSRAVSRIDLENFVPNALKIEKVKLINYQSSGYPLTEGLKGTDIIDFTHTTDAGWVDVAAPEAGDTDQRLSSSLYCFPNIVVNSQPDDDMTTAILIKGYWCENKDGKSYDDYPTYYRFNLTNTGRGQVLSRNFAYKASIKGVKRRGKTDEQDAVKDHLPIFDYDVTDEWQTTDDNAASDDRGNFLLVSKTFITFDGDDSPANILSLRVQTNNDLVWSVARDDTEESINNNFFVCEKYDDKTLNVYPTESNETDHVRFGRFIITARSVSDSSVELKLTVNIQHLTTKFNYTMLTVDGSTGSFTKKLNPNGGKLALKVLTGAASNAWFAIDEDNNLKNWGSDTHFSEGGNNGADLEITYDPNVTKGSREATLKVYLDPSINGDGSVKPVYVTFTQEPTTDLFTLSPAPVDGTYEIDCCSWSNIPSLTPGNGNKIVNRFTITVTPAAGVNVKFSSNANARDIGIKPDGFLNDVGVSSEKIETDESKFATQNEFSNPRTYYFTPAAMAPNDAAITGYKIVIEATDPVTGNSQKRTVTFKLKAIEGEVNDCIIKGATEGEYWLIPDRNLGCPGRISSITGEKQTPLYCASGYNFIPGFQSSQSFGTHTEWLGSDITRNAALQELTPWLRDINADEGKIYSPFYTSADLDKWSFLPERDTDANHTTLWSLIASRTVFSKQRGFILSEFPRIKEGKKLPVFRWLNRNAQDGNGYYFDSYAGFLVTGNVINYRNVNMGLAFPVRKLTKEQVKDYLLNYLGYDQSTLPDELR